jgi:polysaccharide biosynthesis transport protein
MATLSSLLTVFSRHKVQALLAFSVVFGSCLLTGALTKAEYQSEAKLLFQETMPEASGIVGIDSNTTFARASDPLENKLEMIRTEPLLKAAIGAIPPSIREDISTGQLRGGLVTKQILGTDIVVLSFKSSNPETARAVVAAVADSFIHEMILNNRSRATAFRKFLEVKIPSVEKELRSAEKNVQEFQKASGSVAISIEAQSAVSNRSALEIQERTLQSQLLSEQSQMDDIRRKLGGQSTRQALRSVAVIEDPEMQALRAQLASIDAEIAKQKTRLGDEHPQMQSLQRQRVSLQSLIDSRTQFLGGQADASTNQVNSIAQSLTNQLVALEVKRSGTLRELNATQVAILQSSQKLKQLPQQQVVFAQLSRKVQVSTTAYNMLANKLEEAKVAEAQVLANIRLVEPASTPERPVWPNFTFLGVVGTAVGVIAAAGAVAFKEAFSRKVLSNEDVVHLQLPILASVPWLSNGGDKALKTWNQESYRILCMNLRFLGGQDIKTMVSVVSSAMTDEGKSTVATRLACSMAQAQQRTLLIDADLVRPSLESVFGLQGCPGLSEWLLEYSTTLNKGKEAPRIAPYIIQSTSYQNLSVLTAGQVRLEDSASFLGSAAIDALLAQLQDFDQVLFDTPPMAGFAHAYLLGAKARGILLVVRPEHSEQEPLLKAKQLIERNRIPLLGIVMNGTPPRLEMGYGYYNRKENNTTLRLPASKE